MTENIPTEVGHITLDPDALARQIDAIAAASLDPDAAERLADIAQTLLTELIVRERRIGETWKLIGRCDLAFELIETSMRHSSAKRTAKQLRAEIKKASGL